MIGEMKKEALVIDDISQHETHRLIELLKPDIFCAGIKEMYIVQKNGRAAQAAPQLRHGRSLRRIYGGHQWYHEIDRLCELQGLGADAGSLARHRTRTRGRLRGRLIR
jgi:nitrogenase molybdenum-iron protein alpha chain